MYLRKALFGMTNMLQNSLVITDAVRLPLNSMESSPNSDLVSNLHIVLVLCRTDPNLKNVKETLT